MFGIKRRRRLRSQMALLEQQDAALAALAVLDPIQCNAVQNAFNSIDKEADEFRMTPDTLALYVYNPRLFKRLWLEQRFDSDSVPFAYGMLLLKFQ